MARTKQLLPRRPRLRTRYHSESPEAALPVTSLLSLPTELLLIVGEALKDDDDCALSALWRTNCRLHFALDQLVWSHYTIPSYDPTQARRLLRLTSDSAISKRVRELRIRFDNPFDSAGKARSRYAGTILAVLAGTSLSQVTSVDLTVESQDDEDEVGRREVSKEISRALSKLNRLRKLELTVTTFEDTSFKLRRDIPSLVDLTLNCGRISSKFLTARSSLKNPSQPPIATLTRLTLTETSDASIVSALINPCIESLRFLRIVGKGEENETTGRFEPEPALSYKIFGGLQDKLDEMSRDTTVVLPLERSEISTYKAFEAATDVPSSAFEHLLDDKGESRPIIVPKYVLGLLLELLTEHAPSLRHVVVEDFDSITSFPPGKELNVWPVVSGITELELIANADEDDEGPPSLLSSGTLTSLRTFLSRFPFLTRLYLRGFLESHDPSDFVSTDIITCAALCPAFFTLFAICEREVPLLERVEFRGDDDWDSKALICRKADDGSWSREIYSVY